MSKNLGWRSQTKSTRYLRSLDVKIVRGVIGRGTIKTVFPTFQILTSTYLEIRKLSVTCGCCVKTLDV